MRRRDFTIGLLLVAAPQSVEAQERAKQHRIAIVIPAAPVASINETGVRAWQAFFAELRRVGDIEGQNLTIERYSGEGRPEAYAELAREVVNRKPEVIVAANDATARAARAATSTIPIVWIGGDPIQAGVAASLAHPGGNVTGVTVFAGAEIWGCTREDVRLTSVFDVPAQCRVSPGCGAPAAATARHSTEEHLASAGFRCLARPHVSRDMLI
jgi:putative ABC transport system substrate-binding protein